MRDVNMSSIRSIERAIDVLQSFSIENPSLTVEEISKITEIPNSTVYRILCTLERRRLVKYDEKTSAYKPGLRLMEFSYLISSLIDIRQEAEDLLIELHHRTNQTVLLAVKEGDEILYIYKKEKYEGLKFSSVVGQRRPFIYGVLGPVLLAYESKKQIENILNIPVAQHTPFTVTDKKIIRERLQQIKRDRVYIESNETNIGVTGLGSPVFDGNEEAIAAIGVVGPSVIMDDQIEKIKQILLEISNKISRRMGYTAE